MRLVYELAICGGFCFCASAVMAESTWNKLPPPLPAYQATTSLPRPDRGIPRTEYLDLEHWSGGNAVSHLVVAKSLQPVNEDMLYQLSAGYSGADELTSLTEFPRQLRSDILANLKAASDQNYFVVPFGVPSSTIAAGRISLGRFDPNVGGFPIVSGMSGPNCWDQLISDGRGNAIHVRTAKLPCVVTLEKDATERLNAILSSPTRPNVRGHLFLFAPAAPSTNRRLVAVPTFAEIEVVRTDSGSGGRATGEVVEVIELDAGVEP